MVMSTCWSRCDGEEAVGGRLISTDCILVLAFEKSPGHGRHTVSLSIPTHPDLRATVGRHRSLAKGYATMAVRLIDTLLARQAGRSRGGSE